jgi:hypothetical protein
MNKKTLPPPPAAVAAYFQRRRSSIAEITEENIAFNERLWTEICGASTTGTACGPQVAA